MKVAVAVQAAVSSQSGVLGKEWMEDGLYYNTHHRSRNWGGQGGAGPPIYKSGGGPAPPMLELSKVFYCENGLFNPHSSHFCNNFLGSSTNYNFKIFYTHNKTGMCTHMYTLMSPKKFGPPNIKHLWIPTPLHTNMLFHNVMRTLSLQCMSGTLWRYCITESSESGTFIAAIVIPLLIVLRIAVLLLLPRVIWYQNMKLELIST